ncbi:MAG: hypothetical protein WC822_00600 [Candidatus Paceibacterota bacterium]|jgi:hypothetical protein
MENENKLKNRTIETYTKDMAKAIENDKGGLIKKIIHEAEEHENQKKNLSPDSKKNRIFIIVSFTLILIALVVLFFLIFFRKEINTVPVVSQSVSIIFSDKTEFKAIDGLTKDKIAETFLSEVKNTKVKIGGVEGIYLTENQKVVGFKRFNEIIKSNLVLGENDFFSDNFLLGAFKSGLSSVAPNIGDPFFLLKVRSFADAFPLMSNWEQKMLYDLHGFLGVNISPTTNYLFTKNFEDGIIDNKNARILKDNDGKIILMYVFVNDSTIIISDSEEATHEVVLRVNSSQIKK